MVRPQFFGFLFTAVCGGLSILLLADGDATALSRSFESPLVPAMAELPAVSAGPADPESLEALETALASQPHGHEHDEHAKQFFAPALSAREAVARYAIEDDAGADVATVLDFFDGRHSGLTEDELLRVAHTIVDEARAESLEVELVLAVIRIESAGYNFAVSHVGALGLMQIMPRTGEWLAEREGIEWRGTETLFDPEVNVRLGVRYLEELHTRYDGDVHTALAAYNWGPGRIDGFLRRGSDVPVRYSRKVMKAYSSQLEKAQQPVASPRSS